MAEDGDGVGFALQLFWVLGMRDDMWGEGRRGRGRLGT